ncbi:hypothetical protein KAU09_00855 [Candidatus Parcubacteria bacterium]|nr:hypothetical protein [Candidatus Parcubacteria bacterium]
MQEKIQVEKIAKSKKFKGVEGEKKEKVSIEKAEEDIKKEEKIQEKEIIKEVADYFKNGLFINKKDLEGVKGFSALSEGRQLLVLENLKQISLGRIEREAISEQKKEQKNFVGKKGKFWQIKNDWADTKEHLKVFSQNIWNNGIKNFAGKKVAELEKLKVEDMEKGGMEVYGTILNQLVAGLTDEEGKMKEDIPEVEKIENKKGGYGLEVKYFAVSNEMSEKEKESVEKFNQSASEFSKIPDQWSDKTAKFSERRQYKKARKKYEKERNKIIEIKAEQSGDENALLEMNEIDYKLQMNQFLNSYPDVEEQIQSIKNKTAWKRAMGSMFRERGFQFGAGFMARTATIALGGAAGLSVALSAPAAVLGLGAHRAIKKGKKSLDEGYELSRWTTSEEAKQAGKNEADFLKEYAETKRKIRELKEKDENETKAGYKGEIRDYEDEIKKYENKLKVLDKQEARRLLTKKDYVDADYLSDSFEDLIDELENENFAASLKLEGKKQQEIKDNRRDEMLKSLMFHIEETQEKLNNKTVNFGGEDEFLPNQYRLIEKLSKAEGLVSAREAFKNIDINKLEKEYTESSDGIKELIYNIQNKKISKAKRNYLLGKAGIGIATSAAFFYAGSHIRDCVGEYIPGSVKEFTSDTYSNIKRDLAKLNLDLDITDVGQIDKDVMETLKNLSEQDKEYIAKYSLSEYIAQRQLSANLTLDAKGDATGKIEPSEPTHEPAKGAPREVIEELEETVKKQEAIKNIAAKFAEQEAAMAEYGIKNNFTVKLGEKGTPARLEPTMHAIAMNAMDDEKMYTEIKGGIKLFDEAPAARSLNVAANLTKMAEGKLNSIKGVDISEEMQNSFSFDKKTGQLEIKNYAEFNKLVEGLHAHAEDLWDKGVLQKGAAAYLDRIKGETWQDIIEANGLEKQVEGHDDLDVEIKDFKDSEMVKVAKAEMEKAEMPEEEEALQEVEVMPEQEPQAKEHIQAMENAKKIDGIIKNIANERMNGKITEVYKHWGGGNQIEEWAVTREKSAQDVLNGKFGETVGDKLDMAESNNREQLQDYLKEAEKTLGAPNRGETVEDYLLRFEAGVFEKYSEADTVEHIKFLREHTDLNVDYIKGIYKQMPNSFYNNGEQALNYLKISAGDDREVSKGLKGMFNLNYEPQSPYGFTQDLKTGIITIHDVKGKEGINVLIDLKNNKFGAEIDNAKDYNIKRKFLGLGKAVPTGDFDIENVEYLNGLVGGESSSPKGIVQGFESVEKGQRKGFEAE